MKDASASAPALAAPGTVLKPLPELHRTLLDDKAKRQVAAEKDRGYDPESTGRLWCVNIAVVGNMWKVLVNSWDISQ